MLRIILLLFVISAPTSGAFGQEGVSGLVPSVELQKTGEVRQCLRRERINGFAALSETRFLFDTSDGFYLNEPARECEGAMRKDATFKFATGGSMICRNDQIVVWTKTRSGRITSCALRDFQELAPVSGPASQ